MCHFGSGDVISSLSHNLTNQIHASFGGGLIGIFSRVNSSDWKATISSCVRLSNKE